MSRSSIEKKFKYQQLHSQHIKYSNVAAASGGLISKVVNKYDPLDPTSICCNNVAGGEAYQFEKEDVIPVYGSQTSYNIHPVLHTNIIESEYHRSISMSITSVEELIDDICRGVITHAEPWQSGLGAIRVPSTCFCLLLRLMQLQPTIHDIVYMMQYQNNVYVRVLGILCIRYICHPTFLWKWFEPFLDDQESVAITTTGTVSTIGAFIVKLLMEMGYYNTTLPRIPIPIERNLHTMFSYFADRKTRRLNNLMQVHRFQTGAAVQAIYQDDENEPCWYMARIVEQQPDHRYVVAFTNYAGQVIVDIADLSIV